MFELKIVDRVSEIPRESWDALVGENDSPFVEHTWLDCIEEAQCVGRGTGWAPCHLALYQEKKLVAVAPSYLKGNSEGEFVFDWSWAELASRIGVPYYPKMIFAVPFTPAAGARLLVSPDVNRDDVVRSIAHAVPDILKELGAYGAHVLFPRDEEAAQWEASGFMRRLGVQYQFTNASYENFEDFLKQFPSKKRTQLRRERKQPAKDGITIATLTKDEYDAAAVRDMFRFYGVTVDKFSWGRRYLNRRFFELVAERFSHRLSWVFAKRDGKAIAGAFNVKKNDILYGRYWGADEELPFLHFNVCYYHGIEECISEKLRLFEPGAGGEHKRVRGFAPTITHSAHYVTDPRMRRILSNHLQEERAHILRYVGAGGESDEFD
ncbi:MAG: GNAT family N-acetyltransferase [Polyangiaceae bacterium]